MIEPDLKIIRFIYIYDGEISSEDFSLANAAIQEVGSYYPGFAIEKRIERLDFPVQIPVEKDIARVIFSRNEEFLSK